MTELESTFISLVKLGIGTSTEESIPLHTDWESLRALADEQGLSAVVLDGIEQLLEGQRPPQLKLLTWIGEVAQGYEYRYEAYGHAIAKLTSFYNAHGLRMMVLKGYGCSLDWPRPSHRPCGDIDIWLFGQQKVADKMLARELGIKIDTSHHHHTVFSWNGFTVENHYDFINVHHHKSHKSLERVLKDLGRDDSYYVDVYGERVFISSPNLSALFLLRHSMLHFAFGEFSLRHLLDWAFFVEKHWKDVDWIWLKDVLEQHGMTPLFYLFNAICVEDLGFEISLFPKGEADATMKERVLNEILSPEFQKEPPVGFIPRVLSKYRRWQANGWKHKLCYKEIRWSAFWSGVWGHILRPKTI